MRLGERYGEIEYGRVIQRRIGHVYDTHVEKLVCIFYEQVALLSQRGRAMLRVCQ